MIFTILLSGNENEPCYECGKPAKYKLDVEDGEKEFTAPFCSRCALQIILGDLKKDVEDEEWERD